MPVVAHILPHIVAAGCRHINDERDLGLCWVQATHLFRCDREVNAAPGDRAARGDLSREVQLHRVRQRIEGAPGEQGALLHLKLVRGRDKGKPGADQVALRIILEFRVRSQD